MLLWFPSKLVWHYYAACQEQQGSLDESFAVEISKGTYANKAILVLWKEVRSILWDTHHWFEAISNFLSLQMLQFSNVYYQV